MDKNLSNYLNLSLFEPPLSLISLDTRHSTVLLLFQETARLKTLYIKIWYYSDMQYYRLLI
jgi:hypothetical protein